jgi:hypothetical protein
MVTEYEAHKLHAERMRELRVKENVMVSHGERQKLLRDFRGEPGWGLGAVFRCLAGLLIVAGIAVIGIQSDRQGAVPIGVHSQSGSVHQDSAHTVVSKKSVEEGSLQVDGASLSPAR